jgi:uncharacterized membrane protein
MVSPIRFKQIKLKSIKGSDYFILFIMVLIYVTVISSLAIMSHYSFYTNAWDLGIYAQALYSTLNHGKLLYYSVEAIGNPQRSLFGIHFVPFLFFLVPVYALYQSPITLLILRPIAISMGLIPLYWIMCESKISSRGLKIVLAAIYLIYPPMLGSISNFDVLSFLPALFLFALHYLRKGDNLRAYIFIILALMVNEFVSLIVVAAAFYTLLLNRKGVLNGLRCKKIDKNMFFSMLLLSTGILWFTLACTVITHFNPAALQTKWEWGKLGSSPSEIILNILTNPIKALNAFFNDGQRKFLYIFALLGPLAFTSLFEPLALVMAIPWLAASLISINPLYYSIQTQYPAFVAPFIFISAIDGLKKLMSFNARVMKRTASVMVVVLLISTLLIPFENFRFSKSSDAIWLALKDIPSDASISVMPDIYPHVCNRLEVYPYFVEGVDYVLININSWWYDVTLPRPAHTAPRWCEINISNNYGITLNMDGIILYERGYNGSIKYFRSLSFRYSVYDMADSFGDITQVMDGSTIVNVLIHKAGSLSPLLFRTPFRYFPPGNYNVTVRLKASSIENIKFEIRTKPGEIMVFGEELSVSNLPNNEWKDLSFSFAIKKPLPLEFVAYVGNSTDVYFQFLNVLQVSGV